MTSRLSTRGNFPDAMSASRAASGSASIPTDAGARTGSARRLGAAASAAAASNAEMKQNCRVRLSMNTSLEFFGAQHGLRERVDHIVRSHMGDHAAAIQLVAHIGPHLNQQHGG